jgi:DNA-binding NarL/FixJ family response regulator
VITVVLVEDHTSYAQALAAVIELTDDIEVVGRAQSAAEAAQVLAQQAPDVAVVDLDLPGAGGVDVLDDLRDRRADTAAVVLTALTDEAELGRAVEAGAAAVLHKSVDVTELLDVIRRVADGATVLAAGPTSSWLRALAAERERTWMARTMRDTLTPRETEILELLAAGHGSDAIASRLVISADTVQTHVRNLLGKLGVGSRLEAVTLAIRMGIVTPDDEAPAP